MITDLTKRPVVVDPRASLSSLFALGFRPFFLLAGIFATLAVPLWLCVYAGDVRLATTLPPSAWHSHEMIFGLVGAVLAGFLLTAARNWTSIPTLSGAPLAALALLWLAGRFAMAFDASSGRWPSALIDLAFLPTLAIVLARPIIRARNWRNLGFVVLLGLLFGANLLFHVGGPLWYSRAAGLGVDILVMIIVVMGGRVIPSFTESALKVVAVRWRVLEWGSLASLGIVTALQVVPGAERVAGVAMIVAGVINGARMLAWHSLATRRQPILWVLHLGYGWIALGLVLSGVTAFVPSWPASAPTHALTVGAIGMMILGMMSRVSLGHTGRMLVVRRSLVVAFGALFLAALVRALGPLVAPSAYFAELILAGALWTLAFGLFTAAYARILIAPRVDGKPG